MSFSLTENSLFNAEGVIESALNTASGEVLGTFRQGQSNTYQPTTTLASLGVTGGLLHDFHNQLQVALQITIPWTVVEAWVTMGDVVNYFISGSLVNGAILPNPAYDTTQAPATQF